MQRNLSNSSLFLLLVAIVCTASTPAWADWDPTNPDDLARAKWIQLPDLTPTGMDILDTLQPVEPAAWKILADDFLCVESGPITDVHLWGSWLNDLLPTNSGGQLDAGNVRFKLSFHSDVPVDTSNPFSHPGTELWSAIFEPGDFNVNPNVITAPEQFYDPNLDQIIGIDSLVYQYNFTDFAEPFVQTEGTIYWLDVQTEVLGNLPGETPATFGWKTRDPNQHFNDDAVFADTNGFAGPLVTAWSELRYPLGHPLETQSIDLSFVLTVPEPSSVIMAGVGLIGLIGMICRRRRRKTC